MGQSSSAERKRDLSRDTPKHDMPFGSDTRFVYDWKAVRSRKIGVDADPEISDMIVQMINSHENFGSTTCMIRPSFPIHMLEQTHIRLFDEEMTFLRLLFSILCTPSQASQASKLKDVDCGDPSSKDAPMADQQQPDPTPEKDTDASMANNPASPGPAPAADTATTTELDTTSGDPKAPTTEPTTPASPSPDIVSPPRTQNTATSFPAIDNTSQPVSTLTGSPVPTNPVVIQAAPKKEEQEEDKRARLLKKDLENRTPAPLFLLILPSKTGGQWILVVREKFKDIAENILKGLAAFLIYHLELHSDPAYLKTTLKRWICKKHCKHTRDYSMVWDPATFQVQSELDKNANLDVDERDEWLSKFDEDRVVQEAFEGTLSINLEMSSTRLMDDGSTVASRLRELLRLRQVDAAHKELVVELEQKDNTIDEQQSKIAELQAQLDAKNSTSTPSTQAASSNPNEQHNDTSAQADTRGSWFGGRSVAAFLPKSKLKQPIE